MFASEPLGERDSFPTLDTCVGQWVERSNLCGSEDIVSGEQLATSHVVFSGEQLVMVALGLHLKVQSQQNPPAVGKPERKLSKSGPSSGPTLNER